MSSSEKDVVGGVFSPFLYRELSYPSPLLSQKGKKSLKCDITASGVILCMVHGFSDCM